jgi:hypothetical protein
VGKDAKTHPKTTFIDIFGHFTKSSTKNHVELMCHSKKLEILTRTGNLSLASRVAAIYTIHHPLLTIH